MASGVLKTNRVVATFSNATSPGLITRSVVAAPFRQRPAVMAGLEVIWEGTLSRRSRNRADGNTVWLPHPWHGVQNRRGSGRAERFRDDRFSDRAMASNELVQATRCAGHLWVGKTGRACTARTRPSMPDHEFGSATDGIRRARATGYASACWTPKRALYAKGAISRTPAARQWQGIQTGSGK